jgi:LPXTG-motif cell wall-anchored protein
VAVDENLRQEGMNMLVLVIVLLALWLILAVVGFAIEGLIWLAIIGIILFLGTAAIGLVRRKAMRR